MPRSLQAPSDAEAQNPGSFATQQQGPEQAGEEGSLAVKAPEVRSECPCSLLKTLGCVISSHSISLNISFLKMEE